jgi:hypothetical protein
MNCFNKIKNNIFWLPSILMVADSISKFFFPDYWDILVQLELHDKIIWIGIVELCCVLIFLFPITMSVGFFLVCCYWGAAIGANINNISFNLFPIAILSLFFISMYWKDDSILKTTKNDEASKYE